jgi:hypothetical protein
MLATPFDSRPKRSVEIPADQPKEILNKSYVNLLFAISAQSAQDIVTYQNVVFGAVHTLSALGIVSSDQRDALMALRHEVIWHQKCAGSVPALEKEIDKILKEVK